MKEFLLSALVEYETQKVVQIRSWAVGLMFRVTQLAIIFYVVFFVMWYERGYQAVDEPVSGVTAKVKGIAFANITGLPSIGARVWDSADYVVPAQQNSAFFVTTNVVITANQTQDYCAESPDVYNVKCKSNSQCTAGERVMLGNGVKTGRCVNTTRRNKTHSTCEIYGWCPTEDDYLPPPKDIVMLAEVQNFTVLIKNSIEFPRYHVKRRNIMDNMSKLYLQTCRYHPITNKYCPVFRLGDIMNFADESDHSIWSQGGFVNIHISWMCDLDWNESHCLPTYSFRRLDDPNAQLGKGWNFRYSHTYHSNGVETRTLVKAYGVQFFITVGGKGRRFNAFIFTMNMGSGLALLGIATVLCDMIALNITRNRNLYRQAKVDQAIAEPKVDAPPLSQVDHFTDLDHPVVKYSPMLQPPDYASVKTDSEGSSSKKKKRNKKKKKPPSSFENQPLRGQLQVMIPSDPALPQLGTSLTHEEFLNDCACSRMFPEEHL